MRVHLRLRHNFASRWDAKTQFSVALALSFFVMPDQVRGDEETMAPLL